MRCYWCDAKLAEKVSSLSGATYYVDEFGDELCGIASSHTPDGPDESRAPSPGTFVSRRAW